MRSSCLKPGQLATRSADRRQTLGQQLSQTQDTYTHGQQTAFLGAEVVFFTFWPHGKKRGRSLAAGLYPVLFLGTNFKRAMPCSRRGRRSVSLGYWSCSASRCSQTSGSGGSLRVRGRSHVIHHKGVLWAAVPGAHEEDAKYHSCVPWSTTRPGWHSRCLCPLHDSLISIDSHPRPCLIQTSQPS